MRYLLERTPVGPNYVALLGDDYTGGFRVEVNADRYDLPRGNLQLLAERIAEFLDTTAACPRCGHARLDHFQLWTHGPKLYGCSHGITDERYALATGLPCDCPGIPQ